jgi:hypothetical protein
LQFLQVARERALYVLKKVDEPDFAGNVLDEPDGRLIYQSDIGIRRHGLSRVQGHAADASLFLGITQLTGIDGAVEHIVALPEPYVPLSIGGTGAQMLHLCAQFGREPGIVAIVDFDQDRGLRRISDEALVGRIALEIGGRRDDDLGPFLANTGNEHLPAGVADRLRLLDPDLVDTLR